jgi:hypothetical protein
MRPISVLPGHSHTPRRHPAGCGGQPRRRAGFSQVSHAFRVRGGATAPGARQIILVRSRGIQNGLLAAPKVALEGMTR